MPLDPPFDENAAPSLLGAGVETWPSAEECGDRARTAGVWFTECGGWTRVDVEGVVAVELDVAVGLDVAVELGVAADADVDVCPALG